MGFPQSQSEVAIQAFGTVQAALEALLAGKGEARINTKADSTIQLSDYNDNVSKGGVEILQSTCSHFTLQS